MGRHAKAKSHEHRAEGDNEIAVEDVILKPVFSVDEMSEQAEVAATLFPLLGFLGFTPKSARLIPMAESGSAWQLAWQSESGSLRRDRSCF